MSPSELLFLKIVTLAIITSVTKCYYTCDLYYICDQLLHLFCAFNTRPSQPNAVADAREVLRPLDTSSRREMPPLTTPVLPAEAEASGSGATSQDINNAATSEEQQSSENLEIVFRFPLFLLCFRFPVIICFEWRVLVSFFCVFFPIVGFPRIFSKRVGFPFCGNTCLVIYSSDTLAASQRISYVLYLI